VTLAGCASAPTPGLFTTELQGFNATEPLFFPAQIDQEVPRYRYVGQLVGDENFIKERAKTGFYRVLEWVTGALFGEATPRALQRPQSGAVGIDGRIFVTDVGQAAVFVFDPTAGLLQVWDRAEDLRRFESPIGIAVTPAGDMFVADSGLGIVAHLAPDGTPMAPLGAGVLTRPTGVAYDPERRELYVADTANHQVVVFDMEGHSVKRRVAQRGDGSGGLNYPTFLSFRAGELYVSDTMNARIAVFDAVTGRMRRQIGERGAYVGQLVRPKGVALDSDNNIYAVESFHDYLLVYDASGRFMLPVGGTGAGAGTFFLPSGVWVDDFDRVYVADVFNGRVSILQYLGGEERGTAAR
jgi:DNA-binding beta-propeller fold protein YncE